MTNLIQADFNGTLVSFQNDGYLNATTIAKRFGKQPKDYLRNERTKDYVEALLSSLNSKRRNRLLTEKDMIIKQHGGKTGEKGTWLHPKLAIDFARWLSAGFAVWCDEQIEKILHCMTTKAVEDRLSTSDERTPLRQAVSSLVTKKGLIYPEAYNMVNQRFGKKHISAFTVEELPEAIQYAHELAISNVEIGELMPKDAPFDDIVIKRTGSYQRVLVVVDGDDIHQIDATTKTLIDRRELSQITKNLRDSVKQLLIKSGSYPRI